MDQMERDLEAKPLPKIDATATTEKFAKQVDSTTGEDDDNALAELLGETIEDNAAKERQEQIESMVNQFELGHTIILKKPIVVVTPNGPKTTSEVVFSKELEARHIQKLPMNTEAWTFAHQLSLIGACTGLTASELLQLKTYDVMPLMEVAISFFSVGPKTGY